MFVGLEELQLLEADTILVLLDSGAHETTYAQLETLSTWTSLLGHKVVVDSPGWLFGNVLTAQPMRGQITSLVYP